MQVDNNTEIEQIYRFPFVNHSSEPDHYSFIGGFKFKREKKK